MKNYDNKSGKTKLYNNSIIERSKKNDRKIETSSISTDISSANKFFLKTVSIDFFTVQIYNLPFFNNLIYSIYSL